MRIRRHERTPRRLGPTWVSYRDAVQLCLRGATLATAVRISVVVGTWLSLMNTMFVLDLAEVHIQPGDVDCGWLATSALQQVAPLPFWSSC